MRIRPSSLHLPFLIGAVVVLVLAVAAVIVVERSGSSKPKPSNEALRVDPAPARVARAAPLQTVPVQAVATSDYASCAVVSGGAVACWGDGSHGQLGTGRVATFLAPVPVAGLDHVRMVATGGSHACAVTSGRTVACWGSNEHGDLGNGTTTDSRRPVQVAGVEGAVAVAAGVAHTCALTSDGAVLCWGAGTSGQLGSGSDRDATRPTTVGRLSGKVEAVAAGMAHTCALLADGSVECWGSNSNGQLGDGTTNDSAAPVQVQGLAGPAKAIAAGDAHTCALLRTGRIQCWGWNIEGQLGDGSGSDSATAVPVSGISPATALAAGGSHTCAILRSGAAVCWGANLDGELGDGTTTDSSAPVHVVGLENGVAGIAAGLRHTCALLAGGAVTCWGANAQGQLGTGTRADSPTPVNVLRLGLAHDGSGTLRAATSVVPAGSSGHVLAFTYTAAPGGLHDGTVTLTVPYGWSPPVVAPAAQGYVTSNRGATSVGGRTITVDHLTMGGGETLTITYGNKAGGGDGASAATSGTRIWRAREQSSPAGALSALPHSPAVSVLAPDGSGSVAASPHLVLRTAGQPLTFTYTAARGGLAGGVLALQPPAGWPATPGLASASRGAVSGVHGQILVSGLTLHAGERVKVVYRGAPTAGAQDAAWSVFEQSSAGGTLQPLAAPSLALAAPDGSGTLTTSTVSVVNGSPGNTVELDFQPSAGVVVGGAIAVTVPKGWTAPTTKRGVDGYVDSSRGKISISGREITLAVGDLRTGPAVTLTYENGKAPAGVVGTQTWLARERSTPKGTLRPLETSPQITVLAPDGSGILARASGPVAGGSTGNTVAFTYTAALGGMDSGVVTITVPDGWDAPSLHGSDPGFTTASTGSLAVSGHTITITNVTLGSGGTLTVIYGSRASGGHGAQAPKAPGPRVWEASQQSTPTGTLKPLR